MKKHERFLIYQVLPRLFGNLNETPVRGGTAEENGVGKFSAFSDAALKEIRRMGVTHLWYTGILEHATTTAFPCCGITPDPQAVVKGRAGSPYAVKDYYDVAPDLAENVVKRMREFEDLIKRTHKAGMGVVIDFVPNHVARRYRSDAKSPAVEDLGATDDTRKVFDPANNFYYLPDSRLTLPVAGSEDYEEIPARATGNDCFNPSPQCEDWYETVKLNYGVDYRDGSYCFDPIPNTWYKMLAILRFWAAKGIDAFRCDMVEMVPVSFWEWAVPQVKQEAEVLFIAEVYRPERYRDYLFRGGFDYLYDKVGLYDTLRAIVRDERPASDIGNCLEANADIRPHMLHFLENHDEQRIASPFFTGDPFRAVPAMILAATAGTNPLMLYFGQELGETGMDEEGFSGLDGRTSIYDYWSLSTLRRWINGNRFDGARLSSDEQRLRAFYVRLFHVTLTEPAFTKGAFYDLVPANRSYPAFDSRRHYAFFRYHEDGIVLVVTNFSDAEARVSIRIPAHAFETCQLPDNVAAQAIDLLTGETALVALTDVCPYAVTLPPHSGKLIKFYFQNKSSSFPTSLPTGSTCIN